LSSEYVKEVIDMIDTFNLKSKFFLAAAMLAAAALLFAALGSLGYTPVRAADGNQPTKRTINVYGQGTVSASPDIAYISLGVVTEAKDAKAAQRNNAELMDKAVAQIKAAGVKNEDIKTVNYSIYPKYDYNKQSGESRIVGYSVNNTVQVTVRDIAKTGTIIDLASENGINTSNSISFGFSDPDRYYNEALKKAVEAAKQKAEAMAGTFGITLKTPVTVTENGSYAPVYNYAAYDMKAEAAVAAAPTPVQPGTMEIKANVSVVYEY
jgi:uncharacterized protein YggE